MATRYDVCSPRPKKDGGTYWVRVGSAFEGEKGINVIFDALPLPDKEGRVSVSLFVPREKQDHQQERVPGSRNTPIDPEDSIPF